MKATITASVIGLAIGAYAVPTLGGEMTIQRAEESRFVAYYLVKAKDGMEFDAFKAYQLETHVPLALALPGLLDYELTFFAPFADQPQPFDAVAKVTFESAAAHDAALASAQGQAALGDLGNFLETDATTVVAAQPGDRYVGR